MGLGFRNTSGGIEKIATATLDGLHFHMFHVDISVGVGVGTREIQTNMALFRRVLRSRERRVVNVFICVWIGIRKISGRTLAAEIVALSWGRFGRCVICVVFVVCVRKLRENDTVWICAGFLEGSIAFLLP